jgi:malonyl-CoA O-methyltransferase
MIFNAIDRKIRDAFSDAAMQYDVLTGLHKEIGRELTKKIQAHHPCAYVLDIGMGTGWFTRRLTDTFPGAMVVGVDFAAGMIDAARERGGGFKIVQADAARLPFKDNTFDLITSNLAYQWVDNLSGAFQLCRERLNENGKFCLTMFGYHTFYELFAAIEACVDRKVDGGGLSIRRLADRDRVAQALEEAGFRDRQVTAERVKVRFPDVMGLIKWIKDIGANALPRDMYVGKDLMARVDGYYNARYQDRLGIFATFEVIWVEARKSSEKPEEGSKK